MVTVLLQFTCEGANCSFKGTAKVKELVPVQACKVLLIQVLTGNALELIAVGEVYLSGACWFEQVAFNET